MSFRVPGRYIYYILFEGDLIGLLIDEIRWIRVAHRSKIIGWGTTTDLIKISFFIS
jgi:hypothetical protein